MLHLLQNVMLLKETMDSKIHAQCALFSAVQCTHNPICHVDNRIKCACQNASKPSQCIVKKKTNDLSSSSSIQHNTKNVLIYFSRFYKIFAHGFTHFFVNLEKMTSKRRSIILSLHFQLFWASTMKKWIKNSATFMSKFYECKIQFLIRFYFEI